MGFILLALLLFGPSEKSFNATGYQYRRKSSPIGVPRPTLHKSSLVSCSSIGFSFVFVGQTGHKPYRKASPIRSRSTYTFPLEHSAGGSVDHPRTYVTTGRILKHFLPKAFLSIDRAYHYARASSLQSSSQKTRPRGENPMNTSMHPHPGV